ncbi:piRNA biogenesis protein EXD1 [Mugil cephalus]|uniref:piRNA biogenesis protein EXD1 n=1 Tax=Mugil cephalus TaxID=48193 RepID=UPI001FB7610F|nr:piRNA biogenesis protein EXD1 [Mugil cephalus]
MVVDDVQFMAIFKGKRIKLTLKTSSYFGVVQRINPNKTLVLADVVCCTNGYKFPGTKLFFGHEVVNVELITEANRDSGNIQHHRLEEQLKVEKFQPYRKSITWDNNDEDEEEYINFEVIDEFHEKFGPAVMHIKKQHVIGVGAEGVEIFKNGRLCWLQIATKYKVYLFDLLLLGGRGFKNGLSMILESKRILKVIHDCRAIAGCLIGQFGVKLTNVFDTQVADVMCFYSETGGFLPNRVSTFQEVVSLHLKVPSSQLSSLQLKSQLIKEDREMWYKRPCPVHLLKVMALSVIHLQPLRLVLLDMLMTDYMVLVDSYLNSSYCQPDELECVNMESELELPAELRKLDQMRRERREAAAGLYPVTERGLLARFNPKPQSSSPTSPTAEDQSTTQTDPSNPAVPSTVSDLENQTSADSPPPAAVDRGCTDALMGLMGRGRPLPSVGRGFLLQIPPHRIPKESTGDVKTPAWMEVASPCPSHTLTQDAMPQLGHRDKDLPKDICGLKEEPFTSSPQHLPSPLTQSFSSFRY